MLFDNLAPGLKIQVCEGGCHQGRRKNNNNTYNATMSTHHCTGKCNHKKRKNRSIKEFMAEGKKGSKDPAPVRKGQISQSRFRRAIVQQLCNLCTEAEEDFFLESAIRGLLDEQGNVCVAPEFVDTVRKIFDTYMQDVFLVLEEMKRGDWVVNKAAKVLCSSTVEQAVQHLDTLRVISHE